MNAHEVQRFARITMGELTLDRTHCVVQIHTQNKEQLLLEIPLSEFGGIVAFLTDVAASAAQRGTGTPIQKPLPLSGLGVAPGSKPDESVLVVQVQGLELAFSAPAERLADAAEQITLVAKTLTAKGIQH